MMKRINMLTIVLLVALVSATNIFAETIKVGLPEWGWGTQHFTTMDDTNDVHSARFTVYQDLTVDRVLQYFNYLDSTDTRLRIGIQNDNGGKPDGTWIKSVVFDPAEGTSYDYAVFGTVSLTAGSVYHIVTEFDTLGAGESFRLANSFYPYDTRPYDRKVDTNMQVLVSVNSGNSWLEYSRDPIFVLANGSNTNIVQGPGNPYGSNRRTTTFSTRGGVAGARGTKWQFASHEAGGSTYIAVTNINIDVQASSGISDPLIIRVRESDGTILASATAPTNALAGFVSYELDQEITLAADTTYLITTEFGGSGGTSSQYYYIYAIYFSNYITSEYEGMAGYGGTNSVVPIKSIDQWTTFAPDLEAWDIPFWFDAVAIPNPPQGTVVIVN